MASSASFTEATIFNTAFSSTYMGELRSVTSNVEFGGTGMSFATLVVVAFPFVILTRLTVTVAGDSLTLATNSELILCSLSLFSRLVSMAVALVVTCTIAVLATTDAVDTMFGAVIRVFRVWPTV